MIRRVGNTTHAATACLAIAALLLAGCGDEDGGRQTEIRPVRTVVARSEVLSEFPSQIGEIRSHAESDLGFKIAGKIVERSVGLGTMVRKGDVLARLDDNDQGNEVAAAQADLASARSKLVQAEAEEQRQAKLHADGWATQARYEATLQARDSVRAAEANLRMAEDRHGYSFLSLGLRAGMVVALSIPLVLAATFVGMQMFGVDLQRLRKDDHDEPCEATEVARQPEVPA